MVIRAVVRVTISPIPDAGLVVTAALTGVEEYANSLNNKTVCGESETNVLSLTPFVLSSREIISELRQRRPHSYH
jgi:hypothetical protein